MPSKATLFNCKCEPVHDFGTGHRNEAHFNLHGNNILLTVCNFASQGCVKGVMAGLKIACCMSTIYTLHHLLLCKCRAAVMFVGQTTAGEFSFALPRQWTGGKQLC